MEDDYPSLSFKERDRRWTRIREFMRTAGIECLVVAGLRSREQLDRYITNDRPGGFVVFPIEGEPVLLYNTAYDITSYWESAQRGEQSWVTSIALGVPRFGESVAATIKKLGYEKSNIGVVGLGGSGREMEGWIPYNCWSRVIKDLPGASFRDVTRNYLEIVAVKSNEELEIVKKSAEIGELACQEMVRKTKAGVPESEIYAAVVQVLFSHRATGSLTPYTTPLIFHSGPKNLSWGPPMWLFRTQPPPVLKQGDILLSEIFTNYGGMETQQQQSVAISPLDPINRKCAELARKSYEAGVKTLRAGIKFGEVVSAMEAPLSEDSRVWHLTPLIHNVSPIGGFMSTTAAGIAELDEFKNFSGLHETPLVGGDAIVRPNTVFELEPNASIGTHRINIGGTCIVTDTACIELNRMSTELQVV